LLDSLLKILQQNLLKKTTSHLKSVANSFLIRGGKIA
jgi:hypothetical protein